MNNPTWKDLEKYKKYLGYGQKGAKAMSDFAANARKMEEAGKTLSNVQQVAKYLAIMSKAATGFQVASIALTVVQSFLPKPPSDTDRILGAIEDLAAQVRRIQTSVDAGFDRVEHTAYIATQLGVLVPLLSRIEAATKVMGQVAARRKKGQDPAKSLRNLMEFSSADFRTALQTMRNIAQGQEVYDSLFAHRYHRGFGSCDEIWAISSYLTNHTMACLTVLTVLEVEKGRARAQEEGREYTPDEVVEDVDRIANAHQDDLKGIFGAASSWLAKCVDPKEYRQNINRWFIENEGEFRLDRSDCPGTADRLAKAFGSVWSFLDVTAVAYAPVRGFDNHAMSVSTDDSIVRFSFRDRHADEINIVLAWSRRTSEERRKIASAKQLVPRIKPAPRKGKGVKIPLESVYGGPGEKAAADPAVAATRVKATIAFARQVNEAARRMYFEEVVGSYDWYIKRLEEGAQKQFATVRAEENMAASGRRALIWTAYLGGDKAGAELGVASTHEACLISDDTGWRLSKHDRQFRKLFQKKIPSDYRASPDSLPGKPYYRVLVAWVA